jgi:GDP-L-fucose synthase
MVMLIVTGGSGLLGRALQKIRPDWTYLTSGDGDLRDITQTRAIFDRYNPTAIIHLAANVGGLYKNIANNYQIFQDNMDMSQNIFKCCSEYNIKQGIFILTT